MSSKNATDLTKDNNKPRPVRSWSITARLSFLYVMASFVMLALTSGFLYWVLKSNVEKEDNRFIADKIHVLQTILRERDIEDLQEELGIRANASESAWYYGRVMDEGNHVFAQTPGLEAILPSSSTFPVPSRSVEELKNGTKWKAKNGKAFLFMAAWGQAGHPAGGKALIQVGIDISDDNALLAEYRRMLGLVLVLGVLFSALAGIAVARRGMRPLNDITKVVQRITATKLHERIVPTKWPRELTSLAAAFDAMFDRLEDSFNRLSRFSADLAHELRTPINNLRGEAEVALSKMRTPEEYREALESSLEEYARLSRTIDSLLFLARAESGKTEIKPTVFDAGKEIEALLEFYEALAEERGIETARDGSILLAGDRSLFRRALSNLLDNAFQYTPRGGKIVIRTGEMDDHFAEVSVSDTGIGIEPKHLSRIFDRFYRSDRARAKYPQGSGLGLSIVKSIMYLHNGEITIKSEPSQGTTATLRFPRPI